MRVTSNSWNATPKSRNRPSGSTMSTHGHDCDRKLVQCNGRRSLGFYEPGSAPERASSTMARATAWGFRKQACTGELRARVPGLDQQCAERDEPPAHAHSAATGR